MAQESPAAEEGRAGGPLPAFAHQVAGHQGLSQEGGAILVPAPGKIAKPVGRGYFAGEDQFYRELTSDPTMAQFCPAYFGTRNFDGHDFVILEDLTYGMRQPCVVDIKIGTCTVAPDATWGKRITHLIKDRATTTRSLGLRLIGAQMGGARESDGTPKRMCKPWGRSLKPSEMAGALRTCFSFEGELCSEAVSEFIRSLKGLLQTLQDSPRWQLVSSSLLFVFQPPVASPNPSVAPAPAFDLPPRHQTSAPDLHPPLVGRHLMRVIDFAHAYPLRCKRDCGYLFGLRNLIHLMQLLLHEDAGASPLPLPPHPCESDGSQTPSSDGEVSKPVTSLTLHETGSAGQPAQVVLRQRVWCDPSPEESALPVALARGGESLSPPDERQPSVPLHLDEFYEGIAHSRLGRWCSEWIGFERGNPDLVGRRSQSPSPSHTQSPSHSPFASPSASPPPSSSRVPSSFPPSLLGSHKCVLLSPRSGVLQRPRVLVLRCHPAEAGTSRLFLSLTGRGAAGGEMVERGQGGEGRVGGDAAEGGERDDACSIGERVRSERQGRPDTYEPLDGEGVLRAFYLLFCEEAASRRMQLEGALLGELAELIRTMREGCTFQFEGCDLTVAFEPTPHADGAYARVVLGLDAFVNPCMTRDAEFNAGFLATLETLHAVVAAGIQT